MALICSRLYLTSGQQRASEKIDGYLMVIFGGRSKSRQVGSLLVLASGTEGAKTDDQIAQGGMVSRSGFGAGGGLILSESDISNVVERVLDRPMPPAEGLDLSGAHFGGRTTAEQDFDFFANADGLEMVSGALYHRCLDRVGESRALWSGLERIDLTGFMPTVALAQSDVRREKKRRSRPWRAW